MWLCAQSRRPSAKDYHSRPQQSPRTSALTEVEIGLFSLRHSSRQAVPVTSPGIHGKLHDSVSHNGSRYFIISWNDPAVQPLNNAGCPVNTCEKLWYIILEVPVLQFYYISTHGIPLSQSESLVGTDCCRTGFQSPPVSLWWWCLCIHITWTSVFN